MMSDFTKVHHLKPRRLVKLVLNTKYVIQDKKIIAISERSFEDSPKDKSSFESEKAFEKEIDKLQSSSSYEEELEDEINEGEFMRSYERKLSQEKNELASDGGL